MKHHLKNLIPLCAVLVAALPGAVHASVPQRWQVETSLLKNFVFDVVRGETIALEAEFNSYGSPLSMAGKDVALFYQTNGMGRAWWRGDAAAVSNRITAIFTPDMDPGATQVRGYLGSTGDIYRAAFTIRFKDGPGAVPNVIEQPPRVLDLGRTVVINPPWPTQADFAATTSVMRAELKGYVDGQIAGAGLVSPSMVTNIAGAVTTATVTKAYVEGLGISAGLTTNDVAGIVSGKRDLGDLTVATWTEWVKTPSTAFASIRWFSTIEEARESTCMAMDSEWEGPGWYSCLGYGPGISKKSSDANETHIEVFDYVQDYTVEFTRSLQTTDSLALASDLAGATNGLYTAAAGAALAAQVAQVVSVVSGEDARIVVTNYNSATRLPELSLEMKVTDGGSSSWITPWREMTRWNAFAGTNFNWTGWGGFAGWKAGVEATLAGKGEREYAWYDGVTGEAAPEGFFWIGQPKVALASGMTYNRYVTSGGEVWVLESNGTVTEVCDANTNGYFRISDSDGNAQFEIVKGSSRLVSAAANSMTCTNIVGVNHYYVDYYVTNAVSAPVAYASTSLTNLNFIAQGEAECPMNAAWSSGGSSGGVTRYVLEFWPKSSQPQMFVQSRYGAGSQSKVVNHAPVEFQSIVIGGVTYRIGTANIGGHTVMTLEEQ